MSFEDGGRHHCGLFGCFGLPDASHVTYLGLYALQHRGQESAGIVATDGVNVQTKKKMGLVSEVFSEPDFETLPGHIAIGHVRYSTTGSSRIINVQPLVTKYYEGLIAAAHNGNLVNARTLRHQLERNGSIFQTGTDTEVLMHLLAQPANRAEKSPLAACLRQISGSFSLLLLTKNELIGVRDPRGFRPLSIGRIGTGWVLASETCAFDLVGATFERDVEPGEIVRINENGLHSEFFVERGSIEPKNCMFEHVYFARPDSVVFGKAVHPARMAMGKQLAREHPANADVVVPVPDGGNSAALGYSMESGIPLDYGLVRNHYVGRTFIKPAQSQRSISADIKINVCKQVIAGKRVVVVDDSLVRGTTFRKRAQQLYDAGASEIHLRISCPPIRHPCFYGIDFPTSDELLAKKMTVEEIRDYLGIDSIGYLSEEGMLNSVAGSNRNCCTACWGGNYPIRREDSDANKLAMED
ncbi:MAG: amidophosphoribosyltransferase [Planctomycetota bacterium]